MRQVGAESSGCDRSEHGQDDDAMDDDKAARAAEGRAEAAYADVGMRTVVAAPAPGHQPCLLRVVSAQAGLSMAPRGHNPARVAAPNIRAI